MSFWLIDTLGVTSDFLSCLLLKHIAYDNICSFVICPINFGQFYPKKSPCMMNCPDGCPCPNYTCIDRTTTTVATTTTGIKDKDTVLVLNTFSSQNHPLLMNSNGLEDYEFKFEYGDNTSAYMSCSLTFRGQMYMFGGEEGYGKGYL